MKRLEARLARLEALEQPSARENQEPLPDLEKFAAKLDRMKADWLAEDARRQNLSFEEQIELLKADRDQERQERAERELAGGGEGSAMDVFRKRMTEVLIAQFEQKIRERDAAARERER